jgi:folate-dependent phosphoribosylglycinamide formyltransferase PurN
MLMIGLPVLIITFVFVANLLNTHPCLLPKEHKGVKNSLQKQRQSSMGNGQLAIGKGFLQPVAHC